MHLNFYNEAYLKRFKGIEYVYLIETNDETFASAKTDRNGQGIFTSPDKFVIKFHFDNR